MDGCRVDGWIDGWMDGWMDKWKGARVDICVDAWM